MSLAIGFFIFLVIGLIITIVVLNRGNKLDIVNSLPNYRIYYPKEKSYVQLLNVNNNAIQPLPIGNPFWTPVAVSNTSDSLDTWVFEFVTPTSFDVVAPGNKLVRIKNVIYNETGIKFLPQPPNTPTPPIPSTTGYLTFAGKIIEGGNQLSPTASKTEAVTFIYIPLKENTFQLNYYNPNGVKTDFYAVVRNGYFIISKITDPTEISIFQLVTAVTTPLATPSNVTPTFYDPPPCIPTNCPKPPSQ